MTVPELLYQAARNWPDKPAIIDQYGAMTYSELADAVRDATKKLRDLNVNVEQCVGVMGANSRYFIILAFAVMERGSTVMPISNQITPSEVREIINTANLHFLFDDPSAPCWNEYPDPTIVFPHVQWWRWENPAADWEQPFAPHVREPALIRFTSGTTGSSKGVVLSHQTIIERTEAANRGLQLGPEDTVVWVLSMAYHFVVSIILYLRYGCTILLCPKMLAETIIDLTNRHNGTFLYASPMHIRLLAADASGRMMPGLKRVISTSTAITAAQCAAFHQRFGVPVSQAYGIIEIGLPLINLDKSETAPDAVGYALPDYEVAILDDSGSSLPAGEVGNLAIRGPGMFDAYLEPPRTRGEVLQNGWFLTGDLASIQADGLVRVEGRKKSMINVAGNKVFPEEVEAVLNQHPSVQACRVSRYTHFLLGECVQAEVVLNAAFVVPSVEDLRRFCQERLSTYKIPQKIVFVEKLPMTDSGKLIRF